MKINKRKLELAMARKAMNAKQLAIASGLCYETVSKNLDTRNLRPETVGMIAAALGVDVTEIIAEEES